MGDKQQLLSILDAMPDLVSVKDTTGRYTHMNQAARQHFGLNIDGVKGLTDADLFTPEFARLYRQRDCQVMASQQPLHLVEQGRFDNGYRQFFDILIVPMFSDVEQANSGEPSAAREPCGVVILCRETTERYDREQSRRDENLRLSALAKTDSLTGIANRRHLEEALAYHWQQLSLNPVSVGVMLCDIDYFKAYNDQLGHQQGDRALIEVATLLQHELKRKHDLVARYGGEEFAILLPDIDQVGLAAVCERLRQAVCELRLLHPASPVADHVTLSFGAVVVEPDASQGWDVALRQADRALYQAKAQGRNRCQLYRKAS